MGLLIVCWLVMGFLCAGVAAGKGRSGLGWFILGCLFGPLALLCAAMMSRDARQDELDLKTCPHCAEKVQIEAILCKHCHQALEKPSTTNDWVRETRRLDR